MKRTFLLFLFIVLSIGANAATAASYIFTSFPGTYTPITGGTPVAILGDDLTVSIPIGFTFNFVGANYTLGAVCSNGWFSFANTTGIIQWTNSLGNLTSITPCVMPLWDDMTGSGASASYITTGTAPNRVFTMEWTNWQWYLSGVGTISIQMKLYETSNIIQFTYNSPVTPAVTGDGATIGIAQSGTDYQTLNSSGTAPTSSSSTFTTSIIAKPPTGQIYQYAPPTPPTVTNNGPVCPGAPLTITATTAYPSPTYTFTGPGITTTSNTTGILTIPATTAANNGTFSVTVTSGTIVTGAGTTTVAINPVPTISFGPIGSPTSCISTDATMQINGLTASTNYTLMYRKGGLAQPSVSMTSSATGTYVLTGITSGTYDSIRVITSAGCISNVLGPITITSSSAPSAPAAGYNPIICNKSTLILTVSNPNPNGVYSWSGPVGFFATGSTVTRPNMTPAFAGVYSVSVTIAGCISPAGTVNVVVTAPDAAPIPNNVSYCQFEAPSPVSAQGTNLRWYTSLADTIGSNIAPVPNTAIAGTQSFYVTQNAVCESPKALVTITVKPKPLPPTATTNITYCQFSQVGPLSAQGQNLLWYTTPTGGTGSSVAPTAGTLTPGTNTYYVSQTVNGCSSDRTAIVVTVIAKPAPPQVVSPLNVCQYDNVQLSAQGQNLKWYTTASGGVGVSAIPTINTGYEDSFFYYVTQTVNGCESDRSQMHIIVNYKPNGILTASKNYVCQGDTISFRYFGNARPDAEYSWKTPQPQSQILSGSGTQGPLVVRYDSSGTRFVQLTVNNKGCLSPLITLPVTVRPLPQLSFTSKKDICKNEVVNIALNGTIGNIASYNWFFDGGTVTYGSFDGGPYGVRFDEVGAHYVSVTAVANQCTSKPYMDTINVHELPDATIIYTSANNVCTGDTVTLKANYGDGNTYKWSPAVFFTPTANNGLYYVVQGLIYQSGYVKLDVTTRYGCKATDSTLINTQPCCGVYFPNAFTPNGDGRNDYFRPITNGHHEVETFRITNRWGQVVYESKDERSGWNGTYNDKPQDMGTYYYYYHYRCSDGQYLDARGEFILMR